MFKDPAPALLIAADELQSLRIITVDQRDFVKCANPGDGDYPPKNRHCIGRVYLDPSLADSGGELRCSECERPIYPNSYSKRRLTELRSRIDCDGVMEYLSQRICNAGLSIKIIAQGIIRIDLGPDGVTLCVVELCDEPNYLSRERAIQHPTCFVAVGSRDFDERFIQEQWVVRVALVDVICGENALDDALRRAAANGRPKSLLAASIPVCSQGPSGVIVDGGDVRPSPRRFVVEVGDSVVRIEDRKVIAEQAGPRILLFRMLWQWFLDDLRSGLPAEQFRWWPLRKLIEELELQLDKKYPDEATVRRVINNMQSDFEERLRREVGSPVSREDIIESRPSRGQTDETFGYRINPLYVIARPFRSDMSQES